MTEKNGVERSTATELLRRMLDECDEYYKTSGNKTWWGRPIDRQTGKPINVFHYQAQPMGEDRLLVELQLATPEQAIAATLGSCNCSNSERTDAPSLPYFWTHDGALHVELPKLPNSISVLLPDARDREVRSARVWQYTRDSGTCQKVYLVETSDDLIESWHPIGVYLSSKAAGDCAEALRGEGDGIRQFARVVELKVVDG